MTLRSPRPRQGVRTAALCEAPDERGAATAADEIVASVVPVVHPPRAESVTPLPITDLASVDAVSMVYAMAAMDRGGRVSDRSLLRALQWEPGRRLALTTRGSAAMVVTSEHGRVSVSRQGYLRIPAGHRRWLGLDAGQRVLLAAAPEHGVLVLHTMAALEDMVRRYHAAWSEEAA